MLGKCMRSKEKMLFGYPWRCYRENDLDEDPFKAVWNSSLMAFRVLPTKPERNRIKGKEAREGITAVGDFQNEDCRYVELNLMPQHPHSVKGGIYEVYAFDNIIAGEAHSRPIATGTYNDLKRLLKNFRQYVDTKKDAHSAETARLSIRLRLPGSA